MATTNSPFRYVPPGPPFSYTTQQKRTYPKQYIPIVDLDKYPENHEVLGNHWETNTRLYDGHNTSVEIAYFNYDTGVELFRYSWTIPDPSTAGYQYWNNYWIYTWIGHVAHEVRCRGTISAECTVTSNTLPNRTDVLFWNISSSWPCDEPVICTPGEKKCIGTDLYECNADGTDWTIIEANAGICADAGACPDFWMDPVGAVICWIVNAFEAAIGLVTNGFILLQSNVKNFLDNFGTQVSSFFGDVKKGIEDAVGGAIATIGDVTNAISSGIASWWTDTLATLQRGWDNVVSGIHDWWSDQVVILQRGWDIVTANITNWVNDQITILQQGWDKVIGDIQGWFNDQIVILQTGWDNVVTGITDWFNEQVAIFQRGLDKVSGDITGWVNDQIVILQTGWDKVTSDMEGWFNDQVIILQRGWDNTVSDIHDFINDTVPGIVEGMFDWAKPLIKPIEDAVGFLESIANLITGNYPDDPQIRENIDERKQQQEKIDEIVERGRSGR